MIADANVLFMNCFAVALFAKVLFTKETHFTVATVKWEFFGAQSSWKLMIQKISLENSH